MEQYGSAICKVLKARGQTTPDLGNLRQHDHILVFNYIWKFRPDQEFAKTLEPKASAYLGKAYTIMDSFVIKETYAGSVLDAERVALRVDFKPPVVSYPHKPHIKGELYALTPEAVMNMDKILGNNFKYFRKSTYVVPLEQESKFKSGIRSAVKAYIYFGIPEYWENYTLRRGASMKDQKLEKWMWQ